jgi:hypothetical protein
MRLPTAAVLRFFCRFKAIGVSFPRERTAGTAEKTAGTARRGYGIGKVRGRGKPRPCDQCSGNGAGDGVILYAKGEDS